MFTPYLTPRRLRSAAALLLLLAAGLWFGIDALPGSMTSVSLMALAAMGLAAISVLALLLSFTRLPVRR